MVQTPAVGEILSTLPARQPLLRRGAIAAGALLAAGSVFGLTAAMNAPFTPPTSSGTFPDQGEPSARAPPTVLDAGQAAPSTWLPVAFPTPFPEANAPAPAGRSHRGSPQPVAAPAPAANERRNGAPGQLRRAPPRRRPRAAPRPRRRTAAASWAARSSTVGGTVSDVGKDTPLKDVTDGLGDTVTGVGRQVGAITDPITDPITVPLTTTVNRVAAPLTTPVTSLLTPSIAPTSSSSRRRRAPRRAARSHHALDRRRS